MIYWLQTIRRPLQRRLCGLIMLIGVCASVVPLPLSSPQPTDKDKSRPFPCQNRPCGCRTAEQCWKKCCCFSNAQKLAWAKANHVVAPEHVHVAAAQETKSPPPHKSACAKKSKEESCCQSATSKNTSATPTTQKRVETKCAEYVIGVLAEQCRGQSSFWNSLPWAVMPDELSLSFCCLIATDRPLWAPSYPMITDKPPTPPPRRIVPLFVN